MTQVKPEAPLWLAPLLPLALAMALALATSLTLSLLLSLLLAILLSLLLSLALSIVSGPPFVPLHVQVQATTCAAKSTQRGQRRPVA